MNETRSQSRFCGRCLAIACWVCLLSQPAHAELGIFQTSDGGETWQLFDGTMASHSDSCTNPSTIAPLAGDSALPLETQLYVANPGSNTNQQTFLRFVNDNDTPTSIEVYVIDDTGTVSANTALSFQLGAGQSKQITAHDLENGNDSKNLTNHLCDGQGKWQLRVRSDNPIEVMGLIRTPDGFLTPLSDSVPRIDGASQVYFANPASNTDQQTFLRIVNLSDEAGTVTGIDDTGTTSVGSVSFPLTANEAKQITAQDLENGNDAKGLTGTLDDGMGKWRLTIDSPLDLRVISLIRTQLDS